MQALLGDAVEDEIRVMKRKQRRQSRLTASGDFGDAWLRRKTQLGSLLLLQGRKRWERFRGKIGLDCLQLEFAANRGERRFVDVVVV